MNNVNEINQINEKQNRGIRMGDIYKIDGKRYRLFHVSSDIIGIIGLDELGYDTIDSQTFSENVRNGLYERVEEPENPVSIELSDEQRDRIRHLRDLMEDVLREEYPEWGRFGKRGVEVKSMHAAADQADLSVYRFRKLFIRYLRSGRDENSLIDGRVMKFARKQLPVALPLDNSMPQQEVLTKKDQAFLFALDVFKSTLSMQNAYEMMIRKYYSHIECQMENGVLMDKVIPDDDIPHYSTMRRYICSHLGGLTPTEYIKGEKEYRNNHRKLTGNQRSGLITIGQQVQVDECEVAVNLIDTDGNIIGKPILYIAFDPMAQIIIGAYIGLINNSMGGFINLFLSMLEPHENQTAPYGVSCDEYSFPSMVLPKQICSDQGSEYMSKHMEAAMQELGIIDSMVPAAAGSYKGGVENVFHRLQSRLKKQLIHDGYILATHEGPDKARQEAVLSMDGFKAICYRLIIELNTTSLGEMFSPDRDMIEHHIPPVPAEIWKYKLNTCFEPMFVTDRNRMQILFALLWRDKAFSRGRDGLRYKGHSLRFFVYDDNEWFLELISAKNPEFEVRYNDTDISRIYVRYKGIIHVVPLAPVRDELATFAGMTWTAYDTVYAEYKKMRKEQQKKDLGVRLTTAHRNDQTLAAEKAAHAGTDNSAKAVKDSRAVERARIESSGDETRNRLLGVKQLSEVLPEPAQPPVQRMKTNAELAAMFEDEDD